MSSGRLAGKVALITGAAGGIGSSAVHRFLAEGAKVAAVDREALSEEGLPGGEVLRLRADVTRSNEVASAVAATLERFGRLDVLFNVVGISGRRLGDGPVDQCTEEGWDRVLTANLKSVYLCCRHALLHMERGASIINLASVLALVGGDEHFATHAYAASKGGVIALTRAMAVTYAPRGIRVNALCPGLIETPMSRRAQSDPEILALLPHLQPLTGTFGRPLDVANAALFLASDESAFITGAILPIDGGWTAQ